MVLEEEKQSESAKYVAAFEFKKRAKVRIIQELKEKQDEESEMEDLMQRKDLALYDVFFLTKEEWKETPETLFFQFYPKLHSKYRLTIKGIASEENGERLFYKMTDRFGNGYRLFIQSVKEYGEGMRKALNEEGDDTRFDEAGQMEEGSGRKIKVYQKDDTMIEIEEGATVLDFAFAENPYIGLCATHAFLNGGNTKAPLNYVLSPGDRVEIIADYDKVRADVQWFEYVHTQCARERLIAYFKRIISQ